MIFESFALVVISPRKGMVMSPIEDVTESVFVCASFEDWSAALQPELGFTQHKEYEKFTG